ncbi:RHS repeat-associated core domain-containing protein [Pseudomonas sp. LLC-1]|uniref:RHS repeat-associated core domain-containing protein n=1 Tax=Pseudomonas sp. LLC-1 TaxID=1812180 RepID=UPI000D016AC0|nr:RHS repeat-associated core domain-containing protein [Pseudomonas sp. LLC-1]
MTNDQTRLFYQNANISAQVSEHDNRRILWAQETPMAELEPIQAFRFLASDQNKSVLGIPAGSKAYTPYGYLKQSKSTELLAFNGQRLDTATEAYMLGNGYRLYNPVLQRFLSPDNLSPFGRGWLNSYAYCECDPINNIDPTGHFKFPSIGKGFKNLFGRKANKINRIDNYNKNINYQNSKMNQFPDRPNKDTAGNILKKNHKENLKYYEKAEIPTSNQRLSEKDRAYAKKHNIDIAVEVEYEDSQFAETLNLSLQQSIKHVPYRHKTTQPQNPINTQKTMWDVRKDKGRWAFNPDV